MKLSRETIAVLKNFSSINSNLLITPGTELNTVNAQKTIVGYAKVTEEFPVQFGIYDLSEFLGACALFETPPELKFEEKFVRLEGAASSVKFFFADPSVLIYRNKKIAFPGEDVEFTIKEQDFQRIMRASTTLRAYDVAFTSDGSGTVSVLVADKKNDTSNAFVLDLGEASSKMPFTAYMRTENMKMIPTEYRVALHRKRVSRFSSADGKLEYYVALEVESTHFGESNE